MKLVFGKKTQMNACMFENNISKWYEQAPSHTELCAQPRTEYSRCSLLSCRHFRFFFLELRALSTSVGQTIFSWKGRGLEWFFLLLRTTAVRIPRALGRCVWVYVDISTATAHCLSVIPGDIRSRCGDLYNGIMIVTYIIL